MPNQTQVIVRLDAELKRQVTKLAQAEGKSLSEVVRELMQQYVKDRDMKGYILDLWEALGSEARSRGHSEHDIEDIIRHVRAEHDQGRS